jgi:sporulation protein YlmC with PRC-barrel domain
MTTRASRVLGAAVVDPHGQRLGTIADLLLDPPPPATVSYALVKLARTPDQAQHTVAVPWSLLHPGDKERQLVLGASRETLRRMRSLD